jgi:cellulose synthase/poly-beta-1,6-N-acetylglucosamine synthase-like glycosyltransferase
MLFVFFITPLKYILVFMVLIGVIPLISSLYQYLLLGFHRYHDHYDKARPYTPRVAVLVPAWNEGAVIGETIQRLVSMDYPKNALHVYVVDDASTDDTPLVVQQKAAEYPGQVFHLRREKGGQGKAHTLNHGIEQVLKERFDPNNPDESEENPFWAEALLIIDADVIFESDSLRKMARHLSNPEIGAVTAYIKEGSQPPNYMQRFIGYEYITAQAAGRRAQNVMGAMFCLAGGAQLHSRENLISIGGRIDTSSLAEDTFTTFKTQLEAGNRVYFEGNATVWAEEPCDIDGLWKQRLRWARGNVQLTRHFKKLWFHRRTNPNLGGWRFGFIWFATFLIPIFMISAAVGLVSLFFVDFELSLSVFRSFWLFHAITYFFITLMSFSLDTETAKRTFSEGFLFPGVISFLIILYSCVPWFFEVPLTHVLHHAGIYWNSKWLILFVYAWQGLCMLAAWGLKLLEKTRLKLLTAPLTYFVGFGPILCAVTFQSYIAEWQKKEMKWDKTIKTGKINAQNLKIAALFLMFCVYKIHILQSCNHL